MSQKITIKTKTSPPPEGPVRVGSRLYRLLEMTAHEIAASLLRQSRTAHEITPSKATESLESAPEKLNNSQTKG